MRVTATGRIFVVVRDGDAKNAYQRDAGRLPLVGGQLEEPARSFERLQMPRNQHMAHTACWNHCLSSGGWWTQSYIRKLVWPRRRVPAHLHSKEFFCFLLSPKWEKGDGEVSCSQVVCSPLVPRVTATEKGGELYIEFESKIKNKKQTQTGLCLSIYQDWDF